MFCPPTSCVFCILLHFCVHVWYHFSPLLIDLWEHAMVWPLVWLTIWGWHCCISEHGFVDGLRTLHRASCPGTQNVFTQRHKGEMVSFETKQTEPKNQLCHLLWACLYSLQNRHKNSFLAGLGDHYSRWGRRMCHVLVMGLLLPFVVQMIY